MIYGYFSEDGQPLVDCTISLPNQNIFDQPLTLLVATGTALSTLTPSDAARLGLDPHLQELSKAGVPVVKAHITFQDQQHGPSPWSRNASASQDHPSTTPTTSP